MAVLRGLAEQAARSAGQTALRYFHADVAVRRKADGSEVTVADEEAQRAAIALLRGARPDDAFLGEETLGDEDDEADKHERAADITWVIDPLDGTRNFTRGVPLFAASIAAMTDGRPIVGAIFAPTLGVLYSAARGGGFFVNGAAHRPQRPPLGQRRPILAIPSSSTGVVRELVNAWVARGVTRSLGSTALHLALLAAGGIDGFLGNDCRLWDIAAGCVMVEEVGGATAGVDGRALFPMDVARYRGERMPCLAAADSALLAQLRGGASENM